MKKGFYWIISAQFFSSLADNTLLIVSIALLQEMAAPKWATPMLKFTFVFSYVLLAAFVAAFADSRPKGKVMLICNLVKFAGLVLMLLGHHPLLAYGIVGLGAAAYSPAKYGILTELLPAEKLVIANGWIESTTVLSIIFGMGLGGVLIGENAQNFLLSLNLPSITASHVSLWVVACFYLIATLCNLFIPDTGARYPKINWHLVAMVKDFANGFSTLWVDYLARISMALTTLFWGVGAVMQFLVLQWAGEALSLPLSKSTFLLPIFAIGIVLGAAAAAVIVPLRKALSVMILGVLMGFMCILLSFYNKDMVPNSVILGIPLYIIIASVILMIIGALAGFFVVPMNALLQHRGYIKLSAGRSIAVQNFNENIGILIMIGFYALLVKSNLDSKSAMIIFGSFISASVGLVMLLTRGNRNIPSAPGQQAK